jgi:hypothetical protein
MIEKPESRSGHHHGGGFQPGILGSVVQPDTAADQILPAVEELVLQRWPVVIVDAKTQSGAWSVRPAIPSRRPRSRRRRS